VLEAPWGWSFALPERAHGWGTLNDGGTSGTRHGPGPHGDTVLPLQSEVLPTVGVPPPAGSGAADPGGRCRGLWVALEGELPRCRYLAAGSRASSRDTASCVGLQGHDGGAKERAYIQAWVCRGLLMTCQAHPRSPLLQRRRPSVALGRS